MRSKRRFVEAVIVCALLGLVTPLYAATPWLHTDANKIKDPNGNVVVLRGVDLIDLGFLESWQGGATAMIDRLTNKNDANGSSPGWYPRVIRIMIAPPDSVSPPGSWPYPFSPSNTVLYNLLRSVVNYCKTKDLYAIIDWHYVANTYDHVASTSTFWTYMAPRFANDSHVIFELFNEPINDIYDDWIFNSNDTADWLSVRNNMQTWINIVRAYAPNNLIFVAGPFYSQAIGPAATYPLTGDNIVIVSHIYPGHWLDSYWLPSYKAQIDTALTRYPVFMSEWGFSIDASSGLQGTITNYGQPLADFREARKISNSAWVASYNWEPPMFYSNWSLRVGENQMGGFTKDTLYLRRNNDQPNNGDTTPPAAPTGLSATVGAGMVTLNWNDNGEGDLYGYDIYRSTTPGVYGSRINLVRSRNSDYVDTGLVVATYYYIVKAVDTSFNKSAASNQVSATVTTDAVPPSAPTGLSATSGRGMVSLDWNNNNESDLAGYNLYRSTTPGSGYVKLNGALLSSSDYVDSDVIGDVTYYYFVTAVDTSTNESGGSSEVSATPSDGTPPSVPTGLTAVAGDGTVSLDWYDNGESDLAGYNVYRSTTSGSGYVKINGWLLDISESYYTDDSVTNGTTYYYVVTAVDGSSNESGYSGEVSAVPITPVIYTFAGINQANTNYNAYACDVDVFPFAGDAANRNSMVEANDVQYVNISTDDATEWAPVNPGSSDETFLWVEMKINELPASISRIDLTFNGYTSGSSDVTHKIYVMTADADWTLTSSWTQVSADQSIPQGAYAAMTRSITSNIGNYINGSGKIIWGVYETTSAQVTHINYLEMAVYGGVNIPPTVSITSPLNDTIFAQDANVVIDANASDIDGSVAKVEFYQGTTKLGEDTNSPYSYAWNNVLTGNYSLTAKATDNDGATHTSSAVNITVLGGEGTGAVLSEWWSDIPGTAVSDLTSDVNYPDNPGGWEMLMTLEGPVNWGDNYGTRIRGYLNPVTTGSYTFWIASDANSELWLSTDAEPNHISKIAYVSGFTGLYEWTKYPQQQSSAKSLVAGQKYYIEVLHKEGDGNDNVAVAWQGPGISRQVIDGLYLSPCGLGFKNFAGFADQWDRTDCDVGNGWCGGFDFNRDGSVSIDDLQSFAIGWLLGAE